MVESRLDQFDGILLRSEGVIRNDRFLCRIEEAPNVIGLKGHDQRVILNLHLNVPSALSENRPGTGADEIIGAERQRGGPDEGNDKHGTEGASRDPNKFMRKCQLHHLARQKQGYEEQAPIEDEDLLTAKASARRKKGDHEPSPQRHTADPE